MADVMADVISDSMHTPKDLLDLAHRYAEATSGCRKVAVGSIILSAQGELLSVGANISIPGVCKTEGCLRVKLYGDNSKLHRMPADCRALHSEINAICHLPKSAQGGSIFVTRYPCESCARAIVSAGIKKVYYGRKQAPSKQTKEIFEYGGVECIHVDWDAEDSYV